MGKTEKALVRMRQNLTPVPYEDVVLVCDEHFGEPRQSGTSHRVYATPWSGDPRVNIQNKNGEAKPYQVKQVIEAVRKIEAMKTQEAESDEADSQEEQ